jgi:hypothetical protein
MKLPLQIASKQINTYNGESVSVLPHYTTRREHADAGHEDAMLTGSLSTKPRENADVVHDNASTDGDAPITPWSRREGFRWGLDKNDDSSTGSPSLLKEIPHTSSEMEGTAGHEESWITTTDNLPHQSLVTHSRSSFSGSLRRTDTAYSEYSLSDLARGVRKHAPDMRMFLPMEKSTQRTEGASHKIHRGKSRAARPSETESYSHPDIELGQLSPNSQKGTIQDRRKAAMGKTMKLTLPQNMPELPSRSRVPISELNSIVPSQAQSVIAPWVMDMPPAWNSTA